MAYSSYVLTIRERTNLIITTALSFLLKQVEEILRACLVILFSCVTFILSQDLCWSLKKKISLSLSQQSLRSTRFFRRVDARRCEKMLKLLSIFLFSLHFWMTRKLWKFYGKCPCSVKISAQINNENGVNNHECSTALLVHGNSISLSLSFSRSAPRKFPPVSTLISPSSFSFLRHLHISRERGKKKGSLSTIFFDPTLPLSRHLLLRDKFIPRRLLRLTAFILLSSTYHISHI